MLERGFALSGIREDTVSPYTLGPASEAPPGKDDRTNAKGQPEGWPFKSDVSRLLQTGSFTQQGG
ncbi:hypothetical protein, partial [Klebsiella pneumoniae]|uniref:hypothetical protein n=1 Tax=Klebsiella pneumoniae TaxID=573 RepID=UPI001B8BF4B7